MIFNLEEGWETEGGTTVGQGEHGKETILVIVVWRIMWMSMCKRTLADI